MKNKVLDILKTRASVMILIYIIWTVLSTIAWSDNSYNWNDMNAFIPSILLFFSLLFIINSNKSLILVLSIWFFIGLYNIGIAFCQLFFQNPYPAGVDEIAIYKLSKVALLFHAQYVPIITGFFNNQNKFAQILMPYFIVSVLFWMDSLSKNKKPFVWPFLSLIFGAIFFLTFARSPIMISIIAIILFILIRNNGKYFNLKWFFISLTGFLFFISTPVLLKIVGDSLGTRMSFLNVAFNLFLNEKASFLFGGGIKLWPYYFKEFAWWEVFYPNAHNFYVNQTLLYGIPGLVFMLLFIYYSLQAAFSHENTRNRSGQLLIYPYLAAVWAMLASAFFEPAFESFYQKMQLLFLLAIIAALIKTYYPKYDRERDIKNANR